MHPGWPVKAANVTGPDGALGKAAPVGEATAKVGYTQKKPRTRKAAGKNPQNHFSLPLISYLEFLEKRVSLAFRSIRNIWFPLLF
ncbi:UNVERIFIED_CONTAM: hypothetical protein Sradi_3138000 [Sesamum radiatum]|uniref:Uncharacterized protein n=1 Tax=Sesamum radiatum TaxID=300843 RepID=A0AAW2REJ2_SESRA